jgi:hypothetical protein
MEIGAIANLPLWTSWFHQANIGGFPGQYAKGG